MIQNATDRKMITVDSKGVSILKASPQRFYYYVPPYQREYVWKRENWECLFDDLLENEKGYFIGSIIYINQQRDTALPGCFEIIDGQQRLITVAILLAAIFTCLERKDSRSEQEDKRMAEIRGLLCSEVAPDKLIVCPQKQGKNKVDFVYLMSKTQEGNKETSGILAEDGERPAYWANRRIAKCYRYFVSRLEQEKTENLLQKLYEKISEAVLVAIEVGSHNEACVLFESLNGRGVPLTAVDLLKNVVFLTAEQRRISTEDYEKQWNTLLECITDEPAVQERFFRHYYNAFRDDIKSTASEERKEMLPAEAKKSNLFEIYEQIIKGEDLQKFMRELLEHARIYSKFLSFDAKDACEQKKELAELAHIQGTPSYILLLYLYKNKTDLQLTDELLKKIVKLLTVFFVRRNLTDVPNTKKLTDIFMNLIEKIRNGALRGETIYSQIQNTLKEKSADYETFKKQLTGDIYEDNRDIARFVLCTLEEAAMTCETQKDMWEKTGKSKSKYLWTIEHIFPEGENIPECWIDMIANGDKKLAEEYRQNYVHKLGNLTLTRYNSKLGNSSFAEKRDKKDSKGNFIGYKNGLKLNEDLAAKECWIVDDIKERTKKLSDEFLKMYKFDGEE